MLPSIHSYIPSAVLETLSRRNSSSQCKQDKCSGKWWAELPMAPPDSIFGIVEAFKKDQTPHKINLAIGAYRDDNGKPYILPSVLKAEEKLTAKNLDKEYSLPQGSPEFCALSFDYAFGACNDISKNGLNATVQTVAGSGALGLLASFLSNFLPNSKNVYLPKPTWGNHAAIFKNVGVDSQFYRYYDNKTHCLDYNGILEDLCRAPECSVVLFQACGHNPTGTDPNKEQWEELSELVKQKKFFAIFDLAYQGFATENPENDAFAVRQFAKDKLKFAVAQSFSKNMGLYGERVGALTLLTESKEEQEKVMSQLKVLIRRYYSNPPIHGARIVTEILSNSTLKNQWMIEMKGMVQRIVTVRKALRDNLKKEGSKHNWDHLVRQIGMFSYTGLTPEQIDKLAKEHHIYLTKDGRIAMVSVTSKNVEYIACVLNQVTK